MKRKITALCLSAALALGLAACGTKEEERAAGQKQEQASQDGQTESEAATGQEGGAKQEQAVPSAEPEQGGTDDTENGRILIAYFSVPEDVDTSGVDAVAGASIVVKDNEVYGNTEYVAKIIQETAGGDLFRIEAATEYPLDHDPLVDQAADEQDENARPELKNHVEDMGQYDTVILGFPNWWADLPMPVYTFWRNMILAGKQSFRLSRMEEADFPAQGILFQN